MRQPPAHAFRVRLLPAWTAALLAAAWALAPASPALAHDALIASDPADGAVLDVAPTQVVLTFAAEQAGVGAEVVVTGPGGTLWSDGAATTSGATVTQPLADGMPDGSYTVAWRSVAADGHPVTGTFSFTLDAPDADPATAESAASESPDPAPEPSTDGTDVVTATDPDEATEAAGWTIWHTAAAGLAAGLAGLAVIVVRRVRRG